MEGKHTPGPWITKHHGKGALWVETEEGAAIAELPDWLEEVGSRPKENARLIAKAPTMYDFLWMIVNGGISEAGEAQIEAEALAILESITTP